MMERALNQILLCISYAKGKGKESNFLTHAEDEFNTSLIIGNQKILLRLGTYIYQR